MSITYAHTNKVLEERLVREFQRRYHHYSLDAPRQEVLEWYALMRHHGAPVRLLDFSYSLFVGLFFALEDAQGSCDVWAIDTDWVEETARRARAAGSARFVAPLNPFRLSQRHVVQQGIFLSQKDILATFEDNLASMAGIDSDAGMKASLVRITVTGDLEVRNDLLRRLYRMGITRASLFPDIDGFARSLKTYLALAQYF